MGNVWGGEDEGLAQGANASGNASDATTSCGLPPFSLEGMAALGLEAKDNATAGAGALAGAEAEWKEAVVAAFLREQMAPRAERPENALLIAFYVPLFLVAGVANALTVAAVARFRYMRSATNYFLVSLSAADLLVTLICMPTAVSNAITKVWYAGQLLCKLTAFLQGVSVGASVFTLAAMSVDRCLAVRQPLAARRAASRRTAVFVIAALWGAAALLFAPLLWVRELTHLEVCGRRAPGVFCVEHWASAERRVAYDVASVALLYALPGGAVVLSYTLTGRRLCASAPPFDNADGAGAQQGRSLVRERRRAARLLALLALLFAACWLPYHVLTVVLDLPESSPIMVTLLRYSLLLGHANSAVNPLVYCFMTRAFRHSVRQLLLVPRRRPAAGGGGLANRALQRRKVRARSATSSSGYDSYQSPRRCAEIPMRALRYSGAAVPGAVGSAGAPTTTATASSTLGFIGNSRNRSRGAVLARPAVIVSAESVHVGFTECQ